VVVVDGTGVAIPIGRERNGTEPETIGGIGNMKRAEVEVTMKVEVKNKDGVVRNYETTGWTFLKTGDTLTTIVEQMKSIGMLNPLAAVLTHAVRDFGLNDGPEE
jgi:hypothetical protein